MSSTAFPTPAAPTLLVVMSGPSGAGKSTLLKRFLRDHPDFAMSVSVTTRPPRPGERDGVDYFFVTPDEFARRVAEGAFIEHAQVFHKHCYGTPAGAIAERFAEGRSVIKDIDVQGAAQIRRNHPSAILVYVVPPSRAEIERRLRSRSSDSEASIQRRLGECESELAHWRTYDYLVINDQLERAVGELSAIVTAERLRIARAATRSACDGSYP